MLHKCTDRRLSCTFFNAFLNGITCHPSFFFSVFNTAVTNSSHVLMDGCEGRVPSDRCPPWLQALTFVSDRYGAGGRRFRLQPNSSASTKVCVLDVVCGDISLIFGYYCTSILIFVCVFLFQLTCFEPHFKITPVNTGTEMLTEVELNVNALIKQNALFNVGIYREKLNLRLFHHEAQVSLRGSVSISGALNHEEALKKTYGREMFPKT